MTGRTKKPPTDDVDICFTGPADRRQEAVELLRGLGFRDKGEAGVPWREALGFKDEELPGVYLAGARYRENQTQAALSEKTGIPRRHISEMENGKRSIGEKDACLFAEALGIDPRRLLEV